MSSFSTEDFPAMEQRFRTRLINSLSGFKSVNLLGTVDEQGITNLSVVSSVIHIGANPALMGFLMRPITVTRDSYNNILSNSSYTFNHLNASMYREAHQCSARYPSTESEFVAVGLTPEYRTRVKAPYVAESAVKIGLEFREQMEIPLNGTILMIGQVMEVIFPEDCLAEDGYLDIEKAGSLACSSLDGYHQTSLLERLPYAKPK